MKKIDIDMVPNYYAYTLKTNGIDLSHGQKEHFLNCINKIYRNNDKFIYRGDKKEKLYPIYGLEKRKPLRTISGYAVRVGGKSKYVSYQSAGYKGNKYP